MVTFRLDKRAQMLMLIVKQWAKHQGLVSAKDQRFNSYTLCLLVIYYLQEGVEPALLPRIQAQRPDLDWEAFNQGKLELEPDQDDIARELACI